jgi:hypothetical protein
MITLSLQLPETVAAEFYQAADQLNQRYGEAAPPAGKPKPLIDAKTLMAFALARHDSEDVCAQFDLALRLVRGSAEPPFNPVIK